MNQPKAFQWGDHLHPSVLKAVLRRAGLKAADTALQLGKDTRRQALVERLVKKTQDGTPGQITKEPMDAILEDEEMNITIGDQIHVNIPNQPEEGQHVQTSSTSKTETPVSPTAESTDRSARNQTATSSRDGHISPKSNLTSTFSRYAPYVLTALTAIAGVKGLEYLGMLDVGIRYREPSSPPATAPFTPIPKTKPLPPLDNLTSPPTTPASPADLSTPPSKKPPTERGLHVVIRDH